MPSRNYYARKRLWYEEKRFCVYCGVALELVNDCRPTMLTVDHIKPRSQGGISTKANTVSACVSCNNAKSCHHWPIRYDSHTGMPLPEMETRH